MEIDNVRKLLFISYTELKFLQVAIVQLVLEGGWQCLLRIPLSQSSTAKPFHS